MKKAGGASATAKSAPGATAKKDGAGTSTAANHAATGAGAAAAAGGGAGGGGKRSQMEQEFDRLRALDRLDEGVDAIGPRGLAQLCQEMNIREGESDMLVMAWKLGATQSMCITKNEWVYACYMFKLENLGQLRNVIPKWRELCKEDETAFSEMYWHAYDFIRADDEKLLPLDKAVKAWTSLLPESKFPFLSQWAQWLTLEYKRPISRDVWRQLLEFARKVSDPSHYDPNDKWPTALDDFVEWLQEKQKAKAAAAAGAKGQPHH